MSDCPCGYLLMPHEDPLRHDCAKPKRHGQTGYNVYGCRCRTCRTGNTMKTRAYRARMRTA